MMPHYLLDLMGTVLTQFPVDPQPHPPPGSEKIMEVVRNVRWGAGVGLLVGFFAGLLVWAGGRWVDHHHAGRLGTVMMLCSVAGAILYGIGYQVITSFAGVQP